MDQEYDYEAYNAQVGVPQEVVTNNRPNDDGDYQVKTSEYPVAHGDRVYKKMRHFGVKLTIILSHLACFLI